MFIQVACGSDVDTQKRTNLIGLILGCLSILGAYIFYIQITVKLPKIAEIKKTSADLRVARASLYTI